MLDPGLTNAKRSATRLASFCASVFGLLAATASAAQTCVQRLDERTTGVPQAALDAQYEALARLRVHSVSYHSNGVPRRLEGDLAIDVSALADPRVSREAIARVFASLQPILLTTGSEEFEIAYRQDYVGSRVVRFTQSIGGIPVVPSSVVLVTSRDAKTVSSISTHLLPDRALPRTPTVLPAEARENGLRALRSGTRWTVTEPPVLVYLLAADASAGVLAWRLAASDDRGLPWTVDIDALTGSVLRTASTATWSRPVR